MSSFPAPKILCTNHCNTNCITVSNIDLTLSRALVIFTTAPHLDTTQAIWLA